MAGYSCRFLLGQVHKDLVADGVVGELEAMTAAFGSGPLEFDSLKWPHLEPFR
jgi:hypothetical protein